MLDFFVAGYAIYFLTTLYVSLMQIGYVQQSIKKVPIILEANKYEEAGRYSIEKEKLSLVSNIYSFMIFCIWILFGLSALNSFIAMEDGWLKSIVYLDLFIIINWLLSLPFDLYTTFKLDKKYGFSNMTASLYIKDTFKSALLFFIFGNAVIFGIHLIIESFSNWWIYGFAFIFGVLILINMLYPVIRDKMFDKFEPLKDKELDEKISKLLEKVGFKASGVFSVDASKRDNRLNAYFGGLGKTKRVVLFDTLVEKLSHNELLAVLGHELGHFKNGDILKNIAIMGVVLFFFFALFGNLPDELFLQLDLDNSPYAIIVLFMIFSPFLSFFLMPLISLISRHNEYNADKFGSDLQSGSDLINALLKLANENKSFPLSHPIYIFFYYSHPPLVERFKELGYDVHKNDTDEALRGDFKIED